MTERPVIVLTNERDLGADDVIRRLDVPILRLNIESAASSPIWSWNLGKEVSVKPSAIWWRQFELPSDEVLDVDALDDFLVVRAQWRAWLSVLADVGVHWVNDLWAARRAVNN